MDVLKLLKELVEIPSPSGKEDEMMDFLCETIQDFGFSPLVFGSETKNVILSGKHDFWVVTHMDVVPVDHPFRYDGIFAYGNGVSDAKGSIASILMALESIDELNFGVAFLSDEEESGKGSEEFSKKFCGYAVVMEPTGLKIASEHCGSLEILFRVEGRAAHASYPEFSINPVERAFEILETIKKMDLKSSVKMIRAGDERHVIPESCEMNLEIILRPEESPSEILERLKRELKGYGEMKVLEMSSGFIESDFEILKRAIEKSGMRAEFTTMQSWTDAINLRRGGWRTVVWGPGELCYAHTKYERIRLKEIVKAGEVLIALNELLSNFPKSLFSSQT
ncbi:MAG: M20/M25/M40 family metallo-hydrolase [Archaeoglobi archaeon]|nr:M20/M25/M40 family metallo-hydrolase [Candidatus Mnemosynella sp.]